MKLTREEELMLKGKEGYAVQKSMEILVALGTIYEAEKMVPVNHVHLTGLTIDPGESGGLFISEIAAQGARFRVPATGNILSLDPHRWREMGISEQVFKEQMELLSAYEKMGTIISPSCTPYLIGHTPRPGEHVAWAESSAVIYANSVLGARTNREGGPSTLAAAITGRVPCYGYHLDENRRGAVRVVVETGLEGTTDYATLGFFTGRIVQDKVPVFSGISRRVSNDQLKSLGAALATSGAVSLYHVLGVTPEARTERAAFGAKKPGDHQTVRFGKIELEETLAELSKATERKIDLVVTGCPHVSITEIREIVRLVSGKKVHPSAEFWVLSSGPVKAYAERAGYAGVLENSGVKLLSETCPLLIPASLYLKREYRTMATNSAKMAFYIPAIRGLTPHYGSIERCVEAAVNGVWR